MKVRRIVYVVQSPLTGRDRDRFHIDGFLAAGFAIDVIDCGQLMFPHIPFERDHYRDWTDLAIVVPRRWQEVRALAARLDEAALIVFLAQSFGAWSANLPALRAVSRAKAPFLIMQGNIVPMLSMAPTAAERWKARLTHPFHMRPLESLIRRLPLGLLGIRPADFVVYDGRCSIRPNPLVGPRTRRILAHSYDVETWRRRIAQGRPDRSDIAVFLDQNIPYHRDMKDTGDCVALAGAYHAAMRGLFDRIEAELGLEVVIAAHPRAEYGDSQPFGRRRMVVGDTPGLVAASRLVIGHWSTAASFAVLAGVPLLFCVFSPLLAFHPQIRNMTFGLAGSIGKAVELVDDPAAVDLARALEVDPEAYGRYRENYLKTGDSRDAPLWEIVLDEVGLGRADAGS
ncbi:hypothetical protein [Magnetospirillum sp. UT-4]|uniref:hypothetical protein n=1 Tax=Magnetospirillum sp. UT-4 TaxID=2681467 RepID=UPI0013818EC2|nr:hypothetical protein [Magnetospirillum sp. UT-4]CAA7621672.1 conserved hypothetical protein [Magnetospirillum sp. UT-4]